MNQNIQGLIRPSELAPFLKARNGLNMLLTIGLYLIAIILIWLNHRLQSIPFYLFSIIMMGGIQHTLATFIHEAAHGHVFSHKKSNDILGHFLFAAPLFSYLKDYRFLHHEHHRFTGKIDKDPELKLYRFLGIHKENFKGSEVLVIYVKSLLGILPLKALYFMNNYYIQNRKAGKIPWPSVWEHLAVIFWALIIPGICYKMGIFQTYFMCWIIPMFTLMTVFLLWHGLGEHIRELDTDLAQNTFTHRFGIVSTFLLYPINSSFHLEHHLFPQLPWHSLKKFRRWAEKNPDYKRLAEVQTVDGYFIGNKTIIERSFPKIVSLK